jgi:hypothetical protein
MQNTQVDPPFIYLELTPIIQPPLTLLTSSREHLYVRTSSSLRIGLQYRFDHIRQWPIEVFSRFQIKLLDKQYVVFEAGVHMRIQSQRNYNWVVMAIDVGVDTE